MEKTRPVDLNLGRFLGGRLTPSLQEFLTGLPTFSFRLQYTNFTLGVSLGMERTVHHGGFQHSHRSRVGTDAQSGPQKPTAGSAQLSVKEKKKSGTEGRFFDLLLALVESMMRSFPHAAGMVVLLLVSLISSQQRGVGSILGKEGNDVLWVATVERLPRLPTTVTLGMEILPGVWRHLKTNPPTERSSFLRGSYDDPLFGDCPKKDSQLDIWNKCHYTPKTALVLICKSANHSKSAVSMLSSPNVNPRITTLPLAVYLYLWDFHFVPNWSSTFFSNAAPRPCEALPARVSTSPPHPTWGSIFRGSFFSEKDERMGMSQHCKIKIL